MIFSQIIYFCFHFLFALIPLLLSTLTSELFEFNKVIFLYSMTSIITAAWIAKIISTRNFKIPSHPLNLPLIIFISSQFISTFNSIDPHTSWFGYYSRFNGSLLTSICFVLLFWAYQADSYTRSKSVKLINTIAMSTFPVIVYGIAQHLGIDAHLWVQDVKSRVFSSLGQPNWLASFLVTTCFIPLFYILSPHTSHRWRITNLILFAGSFTTLLFTKSRSGIISFVVSVGIFSFLSIQSKFKPHKHFKLTLLTLLAITATVGTPFTPSVTRLFINSPASTPTDPNVVISESGDIRKIVWSGAISAWRAYPLIGSGVETFAFVYPQFRPTQHNLLSEWDFIYNKAHNQFLNTLATTGILGLLAYLTIIGTTTLAAIKSIVQAQPDKRLLSITLFSGWISLSIANFFGFSVVVTDLLFFLLPALFIAPNFNPKETPRQRSIAVTFILFLFLSLSSLLYISNLWLADYYYAKSQVTSTTPSALASAYEQIDKAILKNPSEPLYQSHAAILAAQIAIISHQDDLEGSLHFQDIATTFADQTATRHPRNLSLLKSRAQTYYLLSTLKPEYLTTAIRQLQDTISLSPTDPKLFYNLGLMYSQNNEPNLALKQFETALQLKSNYQEPLLALALLSEQQGQLESAKQYYLQLLDLNPHHPEAQRRLKVLK